MTAAARWPDGATGAVSVTFDNLGEAGEQELGWPTPTGGHFSVTTALPIVLAELAQAGLPATFFVEGVNARTYPDAVRSIVAAGHECAYHAWHHEDWSTLSAAQREANLRRGLAAMWAIGVEPTGFRPPGGRLGDQSLALLAAHGLRHCSPAGSGAGLDAVALLPFAWTAVDAYHLLPQFAGVRRRVSGTEDAGGPDRMAQTLIAAVDDAIATGGHVTLVLHTWLIEQERAAVQRVLAHLQAAARRGAAWVARCDEVGAWMQRHPDAFRSAAQLDTTSWLADEPTTIERTHP
jgi:peptidoglycan/xylan/chitin deacetylase (PgdA/CDA1 family)